MDVMVMDVEGTDGRERGEDQASNNSPSYRLRRLILLLGLRAEVCSFLIGFLRSVNCQFMGAPSWVVSGCKYGAS